MNTNQRAKALIGFKKSYSLLGKIIKMMEQDEYCINVIQQSLSAIGLLKSANQSLMENHLHTCFKSAMDSGNEKTKAKMVEEILRVTKLNNK
jgi:DNA-binding FrmR family transcriptional regulator